MTNTADVIIKHGGRQYGATHFVANGMLHRGVARRVLTEIVNARPKG
jgi:hypothetical protein